MAGDIKYEYKTVIVEGDSVEDQIVDTNLDKLQGYYDDGWEPVLVAPQSVSKTSKYAYVRYGPVLYTLRKPKLMSLYKWKLKKNF